MQTRRDFVTWLSAMSLAGLTSPLGADAGAEEQAAAAARAWLDLMDGGCYGTSWEAAAPAFKSAVTPDQWDRAAHSVRTPLGRCLSRTLLSHKLVDSPNGGPKGHYVVLQFETHFEHRENAVETVTPLLGKDDHWRVAGYFIK
jgi:serine/threonine-protein kinase